MSKFCPNCGSQVRDGVKFCDKCGTQMPAVANNQNSNLDVANYMAYKSSEKSMAVAMLISFLLTGLGIVYAGNTGKGLLIFISSMMCTIFAWFSRPFGGIFVIISLILWIIGLILTYVEVESANDANRMRFMFNNR